MDNIDYRISQLQLKLVVVIKKQQDSLREIGQI